MREEVRVEIQQAAEPEYRKFSARLLPDGTDLQGVRLPALRKMAGEIVKGGRWREYLEEYFQGRDCWFEEDLLAGFCIGRAKIPVEEQIEWIRRFRPRVRNWSVCDSFCVSLKAVPKNREGFWPLVLESLRMEEEFSVRMGAVLILDHYKTEEWADRALECLSGITHPGYYARMAAAWALAEFYLDFPGKTLPLLQSGEIEPEILRKTLQKIRESRRPSPEEKARLKEMLEVSP